MKPWLYYIHVVISIRIRSKRLDIKQSFYYSTWETLRVDMKVTIVHHLHGPHIARDEAITLHYIQVVHIPESKTLTATIVIRI